MPFQLERDLGEIKGFASERVRHERAALIRSRGLYEDFWVGKSYFDNLCWNSIGNISDQNPGAWCIAFFFVSNLVKTVKYVTWWRRLRFFACRYRKCQFFSCGTNLLSTYYIIFSHFQLFFRQISYFRSIKLLFLNREGFVCSHKDVIVLFYGQQGVILYYSPRGLIKRFLIRLPLPGE